MKRFSLLLVSLLLMSLLLTPSTRVANAATTSPAWAPAYANWLYRTEINITANSALPAGYQVEIQFNSSWPGWAHVAAGGADLRFALANGTTLPYYIQSWDTTNKNAIV